MPSDRPLLTACYTRILVSRDDVTTKPRSSLGNYQDEYSQGNPYLYVARNIPTLKLLGNRSLLFVKTARLRSPSPAQNQNTTKGLDISMLSLSGQPQRPTPQLLHLTQTIRFMRSGTYTFLHLSLQCWHTTAKQHCYLSLLVLVC